MPATEATAQWWQGQPAGSYSSEGKEHLSNQRSCGCKSQEQILTALYLCAASGSLAPDTDTVTGFAWQVREIKAPAFWPDNQERRLQRRKRARVKTERREVKRAIPWSCVGTPGISLSSACMDLTLNRLWEMSHWTDGHPSPRLSNGQHTGIDSDRTANALKTEPILELQDTEGRSEFAAWDLPGWQPATPTNKSTFSLGFK